MGGLEFSEHEVYLLLRAPKGSRQKRNDLTVSLTVTILFFYHFPYFSIEKMKNFASVDIYEEK